MIACFWFKVTCYKEVQLNETGGVYIYFYKIIENRKLYQEWLRQDSS